MKASSYALAAVAAASLAASSAASAHNARFSGCTFRGVTAGCLMVKSGGRIYNITAAKPRPGLNRAIAGSGYVTGAPTICMQGTALRNVRWHYTKMACPKPGRRRG